MGIAALCLAVACLRSSQREAPTPPLVGVEVGGCEAVLEGPVCVLGEAPLHVYLPPNLTDIDLATGKEQAHRDESGPEGATVELRASGVKGRVRVVAEQGGERRTYALPLQAPPRAPEWLVEARAAKERGDIDAALQALDRGGAGRDDLPFAADTLSLRGRLMRMKGDEAAATDMLARASAMHAERGELSAAALDQIVRAFMFNESMRFAEAREAAADVIKWSLSYPEGGAMAAYLEGVAAHQASNPRRATSALLDARAKAHRIGAARLSMQATQLLGQVLTAIGRSDEAYATLTALDAEQAPEMTACDRADLYVNLAWAAIGIRNAPHLPSVIVPDIEPPLHAAIDLFRTACPAPQRLANAWVNLAWGEAEQGDPKAAHAALAEARAAVPRFDPLLRLFVTGLQGEIALREHDPRRALAIFDALRTESNGVSLLDQERAEEGRAEALSRLGAKRPAILAAQRAAELLDEAARAVPFGDGRSVFLGSRPQLTSLHVSLLLDAGRPGEALDVARLSRARAFDQVRRAARLDTLGPADRMRWESALATYRRGRDSIVAEAKEDWALSDSRLAAVSASRHARDVALRDDLDAVADALFPQRGHAFEPLVSDASTVAIAFYPLYDSWAVFSVTLAGVRGGKVPLAKDSADAEAEAVRLLATLAPAIQRAEHVRVLPFGAIHDVDFHALSFQGAPLVAHATVEYPLDAHGAEAAPKGGPSVIVADPSASLPAARREGEMVRGILFAGGPARLIEGGEATRSRVIAELEGASLFHFSGHADYAGADGWDSALLLSQADRLTVADLLALPHAPELVVLSACETGRESSHGGAVAFGLGSAFLAAGARAVVASTRRVNDAVTERFMNAFTLALVSRPNDPATAMQQAALQVRRDDPSADWSAFRLLTR